MQPPFTLIHADSSFLIVDKPAGLLAVPGRGANKQDCLAARVQRGFPDALVVHRLDMATSGLILFARGAEMQRGLNRAFADRRVHKRYVAVVGGCVAQTEAEWAVIDLPIAADWPRRPLRIIDRQHGKESITRWRAIDVDPAANTSRLQLAPVTGRSHQLRVHLQAMGHPILGDALYGDAQSRSRADRLLLHACELAFAHPISGEHCEFKSDVPF